MNELVPILERHGLAVVFAFVLFEQAGLPIPAVPVLLVAGALAVRGELSVAAILTVAMAASLLADTAWLYAGRVYGRKILGWVCKLSLSPDSCVRKTASIYMRFGPKSLAVAKFIPGYSTLGPALAGIGRTSLPSFLAWDAVGTLLWAGSAVLLGYLFSSAVGRVIDALEALGMWGSAIVGAMLGTYIAYRLWWRWRFLRQLRMDRISVGELRDLIIAGAAPLVLDVRTFDVEVEEGVIPGAVRLHRSDIKSLAPRLRDEDREAVLYCS